MPYLQSSTRAPWSAAVPLQAGRFESLLPEHRGCNRITDFSAYAPFSVPSAEPPPMLGFADYQLEPQYPGRRRQGAGRAVFYDGYYLKGTGRTPLALNWIDRGDSAHATGHMSPSAATRELVVSRYLRAKGLGAHIVACEGLLLAPLDPALADPYRGYYAEQGIPLAPSDQSMQAISVKRADFARWSNLWWLAQHSAGSPDDLLEFAWLTEHFASVRGPDELALPHTRDCTPSSIAAALGAAFERGLASFEAFYRGGVFWGSYHNNFTLDGRFLDLELPLIVGEPLFCKHATRGPKARAGLAEPPVAHRGRAFGTEILFYLRQLRNVLDCLDSRLGFLETATFSAEVRTFIVQLREALRAAFDGLHPLRDRGAQAELLAGLYAETGASDSAVAGLVAVQLAEEHDKRSPPALPGVLAPLDTAPVEAGVDIDVIVMAGAPGPRSPQAAEERALLLAVYSELDQIREPQAYLERLEAWLGVIEREVRPRAPFEQVSSVPLYSAP